MMPSIGLRAGRPTFYLDTSTLSYAFRGGTGEATFQRLHRRVEEVAATANLCMSTMHVAELAQGDPIKSKEMMAWLDGLDAVWMFSFDKVSNREDEHALQLVLGTDALPVEPFAPSFLNAFDHWKITDLPAVLSGGSALRNMWDAAREKGIESERKMMAEIQRRFHFDRHVDPSTQNLTAAEKEAIVARKRHEGLKVLAREAFTRLRFENLPDLHAAYRSDPDPASRFAKYVEDDERRLPTHFVGHCFQLDFVAAMARRTPGSKGAKAIESSYYDYAHLSIGAAYCDVFTCDQVTATWLGAARAQLGKASPVAYANNATAFVDALS
jgi:hypothetical protein